MEVKLEKEMEKQKKIEDYDNAETDTEWSPSDVWTQHEVINFLRDIRSSSSNVDLNSVSPDLVEQHWSSLSQGVNPLTAFGRPSTPIISRSYSWTSSFARSRRINWEGQEWLVEEQEPRDHADEPNPVARDHADEPNPVVDGFEVVYLPDWANR